VTAATVLLLVLAAVLVVLLLVHRTDGDLARAAVEYMVVALLAMLLAFTPATRDASAGLTAGVATGSASAGRLLADAWHAAITHDPTPTPSPAPPATTRAAAGRHRQAAKRASSTRNSTPQPAARTIDQHAGVPLRLLLAMAVVLGLLLLAARRVRRLDERDALDLGLTRLPRRRGRGRVA
jgi:hypothetical protein